MKHVYGCMLGSLSINKAQLLISNNTCANSLCVHIVCACVRRFTNKRLLVFRQNTKHGLCVLFRHALSRKNINHLAELAVKVCLIFPSFSFSLHTIICDACCTCIIIDSKTLASVSDNGSILHLLTAQAHSRLLRSGKQRCPWRGSHWQDARDPG